MDGGVRHFQAKLVKYQHLHIIEICVSIPTKLRTVINTQYSSRMVQTPHSKSKMADGHHFENVEK